jgi:hypothetical protein
VADPPRLPGFQPRRNPVVRAALGRSDYPAAAPNRVRNDCLRDATTRSDASPSGRTSIRTFAIRGGRFDIGRRLPVRSRVAPRAAERGASPPRSRAAGSQQRLRATVRRRRRGSPRADLAPVECRGRDPGQQAGPAANRPASCAAVPRAGFASLINALKRYGRPCTAAARTAMAAAARVLSISGGSNRRCRGSGSRQSSPGARVGGSLACRVRTRQPRRVQTPVAGKCPRRASAASRTFSRRARPRPDPRAAERPLPHPLRARCSRGRQDDGQQVGPRPTDRAAARYRMHPIAWRLARGWSPHRVPSTPPCAAPRRSTPAGFHDSGGEREVVASRKAMWRRPRCHASVRSSTLAAGAPVMSKAQSERCGEVAGEAVDVTGNALNE